MRHSWIFAVAAAGGGAWLGCASQGHEEVVRVYSSDAATEAAEAGLLIEGTAECDASCGDTFGGYFPLTACADFGTGFVVQPDGTVMYSAYQVHGSWQPWRSLGGKFKGTVSAVSVTSPGKALDVFVFR